MSSRIQLLEDLLAERLLCLDGATGTYLQQANLTAEDFGGEDFELMASGQLGDVSGTAAGFEQSFDKPLTVIGRFQEGRGAVLEHAPGGREFEHFMTE